MIQEISRRAARYPTTNEEILREQTAL